ncbi:MAG: hypothetical protein E7612_09030 [Ruminococcaceae bacterium]|nr:hypothetical protein [Oscillospiraceae bacterium]
MKDIAEIDKNLKVETKIEREGLRFLNARSAPFKIYGIYHDGQRFRRLPQDVAEKTNPGVVNLSVKTAGGRVRFITNSPFVAIKAILPHNTVFPHMPLTGVAGFDMYVFEDGRDRVMKTFVPPVDFEGSYESLYEFSNGAKERIITLNFPLYNEVHELYIGLCEGCDLKSAPDYKYDKPIVYYGSSITQGGCASRPGMSYQAILTRKYDVDHVNLGFSGSGRGEPAIADYIASLDMMMFVFDYDFNAVTVEQYEQSHEPFFKKVRAVHPDIPIILMTRPKPESYFVDTDYQRIEVAKRTYNNALQAGDKNVYFIPGYELMALAGEEGCVDLTHPTDLGFVSMANRLSVEFDKILNNA